MDTTILVALVGWGLTVIAIFGAAVARDRALQSQISNGDEAAKKAAQDEAKILHERINKTRDEFVRRDDLDTHMKRLEDLHRMVYDEQKRTNERLDGFMAAVAKNVHAPK